MALLLKRFVRDESGEGAGDLVLVTGAALVIIPSIGEIGTRLTAVFDTLTQALK